MLLRAAPWRPVLGIAGGGLLLGLGSLLLPGSGSLVVLRLSWLLLAAGASWALDEPAAAAVDACPLPRWRQVGARAVLAVVPALAGLLLLPVHDAASWRVALQLVGCCGLGFLAAVALRRHVDEPGELVSLGLVALLLPPLTYGPLGRRVPLFEPSDAGALLWAAVLLAATACGAVSGSPGRSSRPSRRRSS